MFCADFESHITNSIHCEVFWEASGSPGGDANLSQNSSSWPPFILHWSELGSITGEEEECYCNYHKLIMAHLLVLAHLPWDQFWGSVSKKLRECLLKVSATDCELTEDNLLVVYSVWSWLSSPCSPSHLALHFLLHSPAVVHYWANLWFLAHFLEGKQLWWKGKNVVKKDKWLVSRLFLHDLPVFFQAALVRNYLTYEAT